MDAPLHLHLHMPYCSTPSDHHRMLVTTHPTFPSFRRTTTCICLARKRPWDSNAESFRKRKFDFRYGDDEEDEIDEVYQSWIDQGSSFLDKAIQNIFIFKVDVPPSNLRPSSKVLKSYGWMLPFIIISLLLVSGPKAFLLTLGLAIALSLIAYAFQNLFAETQSSPGRKFTSKKGSSTATWKSNVYAKSDKGAQTRRKGSTVSWATRNDDSVGKSVQDKPYGGWDELDEIVDYAPEPVKMSDQTKIDSNKAVDSKVPSVKKNKIPDQTKADSNEAVDSKAQSVKKNKIPDETRVRSELNRMNRRRREISRTPLLLRLLIAAFPFLNSWIKLL